MIHTFTSYFVSEKLEQNGLFSIGALTSQILHIVRYNPIYVFMTDIGLISHLSIVLGQTSLDWIVFHTEGTNSILNLITDIISGVQEHTLFICVYLLYINICCLGGSKWNKSEVWLSADRATTWWWWYTSKSQKWPRLVMNIDQMLWATCCSHLMFYIWPPTQCRWKWYICENAR